MNIKEALKKRSLFVEDILEIYLPDEGLRADLLGEAMRYSVKAGGKRLRPVLMMETAKLFGKEPESLPAFMAAIEMIHNYSLVHDDLPDVDNDLLRRGKATTHAVYGPAQALLAGDALLNLAYEIMAAECVRAGSVVPVRAMAALAVACGAYGMVGGQSKDVYFDKENKIPTLSDLEYIEKNKTGKLIAAAMECGAILAGADDAQSQLCAQIGMGIGVAFQIIDDILDVEGDEAVLGKPIGSDEKNERPTIVSLMGLEAARDKADELTRKANESLMTLPGDKTFLKELFSYLCDRTS